MKNYKVVSCFLVLTMLMLSSLVCAVPVTASTECTGIPFSSAQTQLDPEKMLEGNFAEDRLIVIMRKEASGESKNYGMADFPEIKGHRVRELMRYTKENLREKGMTEGRRDIEDSSGQDAQESAKAFNQILCIELEESGKKNVFAAMETLIHREDVLYAVPDYEISACASLTNDTHYEDCQQDVFELVDLPEAWDITSGNTNLMVGVLDSGISGSHPDLINQIDIDLCRDFSSGEEQIVTTVTDPYGHGTQVAGILGAETNNGQGISGVCPNVTLVSLRVLNDLGRGYSSYVASAIDYANEKNIPLLNCSLGWSTYNGVPTYYNVMLDTVIANYFGLIVCGAGNDGRNNDMQNMFPSNHNLPNLISVANSTTDDVLYYVVTMGQSSNYGVNTVHLAAPGTGIYTTTKTGEYTYATGTSMSAPFVTGVAALIKSIRPDLTAAEIKALILNNVDTGSDLAAGSDLAEKCITGGRLNAYKAVRAATEPQTLAGDVNGDGRNDMILSRNVGGKRALTVYLGQSGGGFGDAITTSSTRNFYYDDPAFVGDFNGDGRTDVVIHWSYNGKRHLLVYAGQSNGTFAEGADLASIRTHNPTQYPSQYFIADVNGDGKDDFVVHWKNLYGNSCGLVYAGTQSAPYLSDATEYAFYSNDPYASNQKVLMGDFNGDGCDDMLVHRSVAITDGGETVYKRQLLIYKATGNGTFENSVILTSTRNHIPETHPTKFFVTDVNGDGKEDFVVHWKNTVGARCNLVYLGTNQAPYLADATTDALVSTNDYIETDPVFVGDVNGDGYSDMVVQWVNNLGKRQLLVYTGTANGTYNQGVNYATSNAHDYALYAGTSLLTDVNGDGREDFVVKWRNGDYVRFLTYRGTGTGTFSAAVRTIPSTDVPYYDAA